VRFNCFDLSKSKNAVIENNKNKKQQMLVTSEPFTEINTAIENKKLSIENISEVS
jgi:hypothetical protein